MSTVPFNPDMHTAQQDTGQRPRLVSFEEWFQSPAVQGEFRRVTQNQKRIVNITKLTRRADKMFATFHLRVSLHLISPEDKFVDMAVPDNVTIAIGNLKRLIIQHG